MNNRALQRLVHPTTLFVVLGMQFIRLLFSGFVFYLRDSLGWPSLNLAPVALVVFGLTFLAAPLGRVLGRARSIRLFVLLMAGFRLAEFVSQSVGADLLLAIGGVVVFGMYISLAIQASQSQGMAGLEDFGINFLLGIALDTSLLAGGMTLDLSWNAGFYPGLIILVLVLGLIAGWRMDNLERERPNAPGQGAGPAWPVLLVGPFLFLELIIYQNIGLTASLTGWPLPDASVWVWLGNLTAVFFALAGLRITRLKSIFTLLAAALMVLVLAVLYRTGGWLAAGLLLLASGSGGFLWVITITALFSDSPVSRKRDRIALFNTLGLLLFVIFAFLYYVSYDLSLGFKGPTLLPAVGFVVGLLALGASRRAVRGSSPSFDWATVRQVLLLAVPAVVVGLNWKPVLNVAPGEENRVVRIMTYNLHQGFNTDGALNIEALAEVIETSGADIIALQEVTRSYVTNGSLDMIAWLSQRLGYSYIWGPTDPPQWGNALLSRYPILSAQNLPLPPDSLNLRRGFIDAVVDIGGGEIRLIATHFHHLGADSDIRQEQTQAILGVWAGDQSTVILGDLNATPEDPEMQLLSAAGFVETASFLGHPAPYTFYSPNPDRQLDYIWLTPDLLPLQIDIPQSLASDHLPVVVDIHLR